MEDLIKALLIFNNYITDEHIRMFPTNCEHDMLFVSVPPGEVSDEDKKALVELGFVPYEHFAFVSYKFGSN